jgi:enoyl-CoA hydratase/carnithine racemase
MASRVMVTVEADGIACVRLARPEKMNALDAEMFDGLRAAGERLRDEPGVRAVVLHGEGRAFCAGLDMASFEQMQSGDALAQVGAGGGLALRTHGVANAPQHAVMVWRQVPVPVIAAVHGVAFGGGLQLALAADLRFVAPDTRLSVMEIKWGLVPDMGGMVLMRELARGDVVRDLVLSGRVFSGDEALGLGFATRVTADPLGEAMRYAREVSGRSPAAIRAAKRLLNAAACLDDAALLLAESVEQEALMGGADQVEAVRANLEKRAPRFAAS